MLQTTETYEPLDTMKVVAEVTGTAYVPNAFAKNLQRLLAALDWARVWNAVPQYYDVVLPVELEKAAEAAEALAKQCREYAHKSRELSQRS